jgi:hypothetical protein
MTNKDGNDRRTEAHREAELNAMMGSLGVEKAPASLRRKLRRIPSEERRRERPGLWQPPRWVLAPALAAVPLAVIGLVLLQPRTPSATDIEQARQELAVAFTYIDRAGSRAGTEIHDVLGGELHRVVKGNLARHLPFTEQSQEEEST